MHTELGDYCRLTNECLGANTFCRDGICICPVGAHASSDLTRCVPDVQLGESCSDEEECIAQESRCHDVCRCRASHIVNMENDSCLRSMYIFHERKYILYFIEIHEIKPK